MDPSPVQPGPLTQATDQGRPLREEKEIIDDQPKPSVPMTSDNVRNNTGGDKNALKVPVSSDGLRTWSYGLLDCFSDFPTFARSMCCSCYVYSHNKQRFDYLERHGVPLRKPVEWCNDDCKSFVGLQCAGWGLQAIFRSDLRRRYGIRDNAVNDVLASGCCLPCGLIQTHREIQLEESSFS